MLYQEATTTPSDTYMHLPKLRELAGKCARVTEFGIWTGTSSVGLLMGLLDSQEPERSYLLVDINPDYMDDTKKRLGGFTLPEGIKIEYQVASTLEIDIPETDLLFIDSWHTYLQLSSELTRHAKSVRRWLAFHDTTAFGFFGEDHESPGLVAAIEEFLDANPEWQLVYQTDINNGLTVLERKP